VVAAAAALIAVQGASTGADVLSGPSTVGSSTSTSPGASVDPVTGRTIPNGTLPAGAMGPLGETTNDGATGSTQGAPDVSPGDGGPGKPSTTPKPTVPSGFVLVPDVAGLTEAAAVDRLTAAGLRPEVQYAVPEGPCAVVAQDPPAGQAVHRNTKVTVTVGRPPSACPTPS
jgi:hypothetical protein